MTASHDESLSSALDALALLQQYEALHENASNSFRGAIWNITKARRERGFQAGGGGFGGLEYSVGDVREQLRASALLECTDEEDVPSLGKENGTSRTVNKLGNQPGDFVLHFDGMESSRQISRKIAEPSYGANEGLRRRGNATTSSRAETTGGSAWTSEEIIVEEEEDNLRKTDPLCLFGVPPPSLRISQTKARDALAYYVEAANLAREIMRKTDKRSKA
mmetsp:Transcript_31477/g.65422  ORF Transcript_31477/g.65422 Transcript_31477/m.65422 type:complete len:220 (+) Transcript_31477:73-732(+)